MRCASALLMALLHMTGTASMRISPSMQRWQDTAPSMRLAAVSRLPSRCTRARQPRLDLLSEYREEAALASIAEKPVMFDDNGKFDFERWAVHRSSSRYGRELLGILFGSTTRRVFPTVVLLIIFTFGVDYYNQLATTYSDSPFGLPPGAEQFLPELQLPITPFELTSPVLGLLLVFRTDTANDRFNHGTESAWEVTASMRSYIRRLVAWTGTGASKDEEREAAKDLIAASLILHGWIMGSYLRGERVAAQTGLGEQRQGELLSLALGMKEGGPGDDPAGSSLAAELERMALAPSFSPNMALTAISLGATQRLPSMTDQVGVGRRARARAKSPPPTHPCPWVRTPLTFYALCVPTSSPPFLFGRSGLALMTS